VQVNTSISKSTRASVLERLRALRASLVSARDTLMHYKNDRVDRDILEPAARRVDELIVMFASSSSDISLVVRWSGEIRSLIDKVPNPKSANALLDASAELTAILGLVSAEQTVART
jgi:hypothetical protein